MHRLLPRISLALVSFLAIAQSPIGESPTLEGCHNGLCTRRLSSVELLREAESLVLAGRYEEAKPYIEALRVAPDMGMESHFLAGYTASKTGNLKLAVDEYRAVLRDRPDLTRARLELASVLMAQGKDAAADHHFRLAQRDKELPAEVEQTIRRQRGIIRGRKKWNLNIDVGVAPDSNINSATDARTIDIMDQTFQLNPDARRKKGVGQTVGVDAGVRLRLSDGVAIAVDGDARITNYKGKDADDISALIAAGPELTLKNGARLRVQVTANQRWYGGDVAQRGVGARLAYQQNLSHGSRIGVQIDARKVESDLSSDYDGEQYGGYLTYERVVGKAFIASATVFARRENLKLGAYSNTEIGGNIGIGGELPHGINAGISAGISRALFDDPLIVFDLKPRQDWRYNGRAYIGLRSVRVLGFSPSVTYNFSKVDASLPLYKNERHRVAFTLARYF